MAETSDTTLQRSSPTPAASDRRNLHNVLVACLADGRLDDDEKRHIAELRDKLGFDSEEFSHMVSQVADGGRSVALPTKPVEAEEALLGLIEAALADGQIADSERRLLERVADHIHLPPGRLDGLIDQARGGEDVDDFRLAREKEEIYRHFAEWDDATRREKIAALAGLGRTAVRALVQILESYRKPDGMDTALPLKTLIARQLGQIGDSRSVYYLAQHVNIGDTDEEISDVNLRGAAAEAVGRIAGQDFPPNQQGIEALREWWDAEGRLQYDYLLY